ncbi:MAG: carboxypeptidase-like regulatory domain-containing protein, partial [bacterium]
MKPSLFLVSFCIGLQLVYAQERPGVVEGFIVDSQTGKPLEAANVVIPATGRGDATDKNGYFRIQQITAGDYEIEVRLIGYKLFRKKIQIVSDGVLKVDIKLEHLVLEGQEITAEGERVDDIRLEISRPTFKLKQQDVRGMAGGFEDVMRSIINLSGVQSTSDFSNQFIVRGGGPDQNLILLDDVEIFNPYRNSGMPSLINPDIISDVNLYAGGYPALYGDRLSSVLTLFTREGSRQKWLGGKLGVNLTTANFLLEGKTPFWNGSWLLTNRRTYNQLFAEDFADRLTRNNVAFPDFEDWHFKISLHPSAKHRLQAYSLVGRNDQDFLVKKELGEQDSDRDSFDGSDTIKSTIVGASWNFVPSTGLQMKLYGNWYENRGNSDFAGDFVPGPERSALQLCPIIDEECEAPPVFDQGDSTFLFAHQQRFRFRKFSFGGWLVHNSGNHILESVFGIDFQKNVVTSDLQLSDFGQVVFDALQGAPNWFGALADSADQRDSYEKLYFY